MLWSISETENIATKIIKLLYENNCTDEGDIETTFTLVRNHFKNLSVDDLLNSKQLIRCRKLTFMVILLKL